MSYRRTWRARICRRAQGLVILGSPIAGTCRFVEAMLDKTLYQTREYIKKAQDVFFKSGYFGLRAER